VVSIREGTHIYIHIYTCAKHYMYIYIYIYIVYCMLYYICTYIRTFKSVWVSNNIKICIYKPIYNTKYTIYMHIYILV
jgi:hypothetical protein